MPAASAHRPATTTLASSFATALYELDRRPGPWRDALVRLAARCRQATDLIEIAAVVRTGLSVADHGAWWALEQNEPATFERIAAAMGALNVRLDDTLDVF